MSYNGSNNYMYTLILLRSLSKETMHTCYFLEGAVTLSYACMISKSIEGLISTACIPKRAPYFFPALPGLQPKFPPYAWVTSQLTKYACGVGVNLGELNIHSQKSRRAFNNVQAATNYKS